VYTAWTIFILATLISNIIFINMLVAIMSRAFNNTVQNGHVSLKEQVEILSDWSWVVNIGWRFRKLNKVNYMFSVVPKDEERVFTVDSKLQEVTAALKQVQETLQMQEERQSNIESKLQTILTTIPGFQRTETFAK